VSTEVLGVLRRTDLTLEVLHANGDGCVEVIPSRDGEAAA